MFRVYQNYASNAVDENLTCTENLLTYSTWNTTVFHYCATQVILDKIRLQSEQDSKKPEEVV